MTLASPSLLLLALFPAGVIVAAIRDVTSFTIPNWLSGLLAVTFIPVALLVHLPMGALGLNVAAGFAALVAGIGMFAMGWCGGGDAKLLAASALWLGWPGVMTLVLATGVAGGAIATALIAARNSGPITALAGRGPPWLGRLLTPAEDLPYGLAIAVGALIAFPSSSLIVAAGAV